MTDKKLIKTRYIVYPAIVILLTIQIVIAAGFVQKQKYDGIRINLLGRQRMLTQKLSKEVILYSQKSISADTVLNTIRIFDLTLDGMISGGDVPVDLEMHRYRKIPPVERGPVMDKLTWINSQWEEFSVNVTRYLETKDKTSFSFIIEENLKLLAVIDDAVRMMEESYGRRTLYQQVNITAAVLTIFTLLIFLLQVRIRQVRRTEQELLELQQILPICASCKRIRGENMDPYKSSSWMNLEEYLKKEKDINFSHGLCPDCAEKLYPGILDKK